MKFSFIIPPLLRGKREPERVFGCTYGLYPIPNIFMLYNAAIVRKEGAAVSFVDSMPLRWGRSDFIEYVKKIEVDAFVFYTVNLAKENDLESLEIIKRFNPDAWVIFMGPSPTYEPDSYLMKDKVIVVRGEAEKAMSLLIKIIAKENKDYERDLASCRGISYRSGDRIKHNPNDGIRVVLDDLPFPTRDLLDKTKYFNPKLNVTPFTALLTSRGCPFQCRYCVPNSLSFARELEFRREAKCWGKPKYIARSFENVYEELVLLKADGYKGVSILDDQFVVNGHREVNIAKAMGDLGFTWGCLSRGDMITEDVAKAFGENNCRYVDIGIESFCQNILDDIRKGTSVEKQYNGIKLLQKYRVPIKLNLLFGASPLETEETINYTLAMAKELNPCSIMVGICNPFPGTEFWDMALREKWIKSAEYRPVDVQKESTIEYPHLSKKKLEQKVVAANLRFFLRPSFIIKNIMEIKNPIALIRGLGSLIKKITAP